jgi:hypothetical protein
VLALLREGLSNGQISQRLGITERTARFHVSEILAKLGLTRREEAALWNPAERRPWWMAAIHWPLKWSMVAKIAGAGLVASAAGAIGLMAWGVVSTETPPFDQEPDVFLEQVGDVAYMDPRADDGQCEVLVVREYYGLLRLLDTRVEPCAERERGSLACMVEERIDISGNVARGVGCRPPPYTKIGRHCTVSGCEEWSLGFFGSCEALQLRDLGQTDQGEITQVCPND